jgi:hypothetical protein
MRGVFALAFVFAAMPLMACRADCGREYSIASLQHIHIADLGGCDWLKRCSPEQVTEVRKQTMALREWATTVEDKCTRAAYEEWARYYDYQADEAEHEMKTHEKRDMYNEIGRKMDDELRKGTHLSTEIPAPPSNN